MWEDVSNSIIYFVSLDLNIFLVLVKTNDFYI